EARQVRELQKRDALGVLVLFLAVHDPIVGVPVGNRGEGVSLRIKGIRPLLQKYRRADVNPIQAAIGKERGRRSNRLAGREIEIVGRNGELAAADPELQQTGIDIDQRRAPETFEQSGSDRIVKIQ